MSFSLDALDHPIVQAPMAGGPSTAALAAAVCEAGGLGFLAAGYRSPDAVRTEIAQLRELTGRGVRGQPVRALCAAPAAEVDAVERYATTLREEAGRSGAALGRARHDDDAWEEKLAVVAEAAVPVVSFAFGCPAPDVLAEVRRAGSAAWVTVTTPAEARIAADAGADGLVVQGVEAGGHRASFDDAAPGDLSLLALLQLIDVGLPLVAAGGLATGRAVAAVLAAGASAAQLGTALMLAPEAGTVARAARGHGRGRPDGADARVHRPDGARDGQPLPRRAPRCAERVPGGPPPDGAPARGRARARRRGRLQPLGRPGLSAGRGGRRRRGRAPDRRRGARGAGRRGATLRGLNAPGSPPRTRCRAGYGVGIDATNSAGYHAPIGLSADPVVFTLVDGRLAVLLARRLEPPQRGMFALPGGFVGEEESPEQTAERKLREKTGVGSVHLEQLRTYADPGRDPRGWLPSIAYLALVAPEALPAETPADRDASWHAVDDLPELALDHARIVDDGLWRLHARVADKAWFVRVGGALLPESFTLREAQQLYEALRGEAVDTANFRRDVKATGLLADTGRRRSEGPGRPGSLFRRALSHG